MEEDTSQQTGQDGLESFSSRGPTARGTVIDNTDVNTENPISRSILYVCDFKKLVENLGYSKNHEPPTAKHSVPIDLFSPFNYTFFPEYHGQSSIKCVHAICP